MNDRAQFTGAAVKSVGRQYCLVGVTLECTAATVQWAPESVELDLADRIHAAGLLSLHR